MTRKNKAAGNRTPGAAVPPSEPQAGATRMGPEKPLIVLLVVIAAIGIAGVFIPDGEEEDTRRAPTSAAALPQVGQPVGELPQAQTEQQTPEHLFYDPINNRHWWGPHNHWHPGPPPADGQAATNTTTTTTSSTTVTNVPDPQEFPDGNAPDHLYYDEANNRHWWGPHNHWHQGPPPADGGADIPPAPTINIGPSGQATVSGSGSSGVSVTPQVLAPETDSAPSGDPIDN